MIVRHATRCSYLGIPTQVVVPSVSWAAVPQGLGLTVFVETPSDADSARPVAEGGVCSARPAALGATAGWACQLREAMQAPIRLWAGRPSCRRSRRRWSARSPAQQPGCLPGQRALYLPRCGWYCAYLRSRYAQHYSNRAPRRTGRRSTNSAGRRAAANGTAPGARCAHASHGPRCRAGRSGGPASAGTTCPRPASRGEDWSGSLRRSKQ
jgi:hypothetical protein